MGGTPDSSSTPTSSGASIGIEKPGQESTIDDILAGDEVEALRIRDEDLIKASPSDLTLHLGPMSLGPSLHLHSVVVSGWSIVGYQHMLMPRSLNFEDPKIQSCIAFDTIGALQH